jgi:radical SAM superfamily enzyme YgiQ (UPF0313 family)
MTYWYHGIRDTITVIREFFPKTPIWLGGIYARLCTEHARRNIGADEIITLSTAELCHKIEASTGFTLRNKPSWSCLNAQPSPALDLIPHLTYVPIIASIGCPFRCPYCASQLLQPRWERRSTEAIYHEISTWNEKQGIADFAFYDDALLLQSEESLKPALERICKERPGIRFHTPNALHIRALTAEWCSLLHESGFTTIRLGLETTRAEKHREWGGKVETDMFLSAVERLLAAGFSPKQIGVYLLCGLPRQSPEEVSEAIGVVLQAGVQPYLAEYSPVPGTALWEEACSISSYDITNEPLYHNNTFHACRRPEFTYSDLMHLKELARQARLSVSAAEHCVSS